MALGDLKFKATTERLGFLGSKALGFPRLFGRLVEGPILARLLFLGLFLSLQLFNLSCGIPRENRGRKPVKLSERQVAYHLKLAGFPDSVIPTMVCVAKYESRLKTNAVNVNSNGSTDHGIFQINDAWWLSECGVDPEGLKDPFVNAKCAKTVFDRQGLMAWYGYQKNWALCNQYRISNSDESQWEEVYLGPVKPKEFGHVHSAVKRAMALGLKSQCQEKKLRSCLTTGQGYSCFRKYGCQGK